MLRPINAKKRRSFIPSLIFFFILVFILVGLIIGNIRIYHQRQIAKAEVEAVRNKSNALQRERDALKAQISQGVEIEYLEKVARENLNLQKEGEKVIAFPSDQENASGSGSVGGASPVGENGQDKKGFWQRIFDGLFE